MDFPNRRAGQLYPCLGHTLRQAKQLGYQEAIEDLIHFLDRKNLGLGDGEGWQIRQWATERLDGVPSNSDSEDEDKPARSAS